MLYIVSKHKRAPWFLAKMREATEACIEPAEENRPSFAEIRKTLASLVPKGRSVAHYMLRAAIA